MALDGITLRALSDEISEYVGASVQKVYQPERDEIILLLHTKAGNKKLLISASPSSPRIHFTEYSYKNPDNAPLFCMLLRKHFNSSRLLSATQSGLDRVIDLSFETRSELGDLVNKHIIVEIMGRTSNIILTDENYKIYDALRKNDITKENQRIVVPGFTYEFPVNDEKCDILSESNEKIKEIVKNDESKSLIKLFLGFSPLAEREAKEANDVAEYVISIKEKLLSKNYTPTLLETIEKPFDFWCFDVTEYKDALVKKTFDTISEAMDAYYYNKAKAEHLKQKSASITKLITNLVQRAERKLKLQEKELVEAGKKEEYKYLGDLIIANIYKLEKGMKMAEVSDWSQGEEKVLHIPIDENLTPSENAQRYYKRYQKAKTAEEKLTEQIAEGRKELYYLLSVLQSVESAEDEVDLAQIKEELKSGGYIPSPKSNKKKKEEKTSPLIFNYEGYTILVGKNNLQNDYLTLKESRANDLWLHIKNGAGSHVIVKYKGEEFPDDVIYYAATLACKFSKAKGAEKTEIDYTNVKFVKKPNGAKPGMVVYTDYKTCII